MTLSVEEALLHLLSQAAEGKSVAPADVAQAVDAQGWRRLLPQVRATAVGLARQGKVVITRHNKPVDPNAFKGVYRLKLPEGETAGAAPGESPPI